MIYSSYLLATSALLAFCSLISSAHAQGAQSNDCKLVLVGAGIGSIYSAYRLTIETNTFDPKNVCIFEALDRPGGRILTVRGTVPTFEDFTIDLGAYRYGRSRHWMMRSIIEDVLKYDWQCYTDPLDRGDGDCPTDRLRILSTRGRVFGIERDGDDATTAFTNYSRKLPYVIPPRGRWGTTRPRTSPRSPSTLIVGPDSVLPEVRSRWAEFDAETDYVKAMRLVDTMLNEITNGGTYNGVPYHEVSLWQVARDQGFDNEELKLYLDRSGPVTPYTLHTHVERLAAVQLREAAQAKADFGGEYKGLVVPVVNRGGVRRRAGMAVLYEGLLDQLVKAGVHIEYNQRVGRITRARPGSRTMVVELVSGRRVWTRNVILNSAKKDVEALGVLSEPVASADERTRGAIARILAMPGTKAYCFWDDAWWVNALNKTSGSVRLADGTLYQGRYHDGDVVCSGKPGDEKCRGALLVSYASGAVHSGVPGTTVRAFNTAPYVPIVGSDAVIRLERGKMTKHQRMMFAEIHKQLRNAHRSTFRPLGVTKMYEAIPEARACLVSDFREYGHQVDIGAGRGGNDNKRFARPVHDLNLSMVNEAWTEFRGWAEGSLITAERALFHNYGLKRPTWLDATFHRSVIELYNRGQVDY